MASQRNRICFTKSVQIFWSNIQIFWSNYSLDAPIVQWLAVDRWHFEQQRGFPSALLNIHIFLIYQICAVFIFLIYQTPRKLSDVEAPFTSSIHQSKIRVRRGWKDLHLLKANSPKLVCNQKLKWENVLSFRDILLHSPTLKLGLCVTIWLVFREDLPINTELKPSMCNLYSDSVLCKMEIISVKILTCVREGRSSWLKSVFVYQLTHPSHRYRERFHWTTEKIK